MKIKEKKNNFRATFLENLIVKKRELEKTLDHLMASQRECGDQLSASDFIDEFDAAQREISANRHYALIARKIKELQKVELVIDRIPREEKFGLCEKCGNPIPAERLSIIPEVTLCVPCQQRLEKLHGLKNEVSRTSDYFGGKKRMDWGNSGGRYVESHMAMKTHIDDFLVDDIEETETGNIP
jgi:phage/conjugal plasmid C-4 type zinc finger TraR family protein